jgi:transcriptional regulator with XRE-family HTH domain
MRMGRIALGMSQQAFADELGVAKSTVARNETLEMAVRADTLIAMLRLLHEHGITTNLFRNSDSLIIKVSTDRM